MERPFTLVFSVMAVLAGCEQMPLGAAPVAPAPDEVTSEGGSGGTNQAGGGGSGEVGGSVPDPQNDELSCDHPPSTPYAGVSSANHKFAPGVSMACQNCEQSATYAIANSGLLVRNGTQLGSETDWVEVTSGTYGGSCGLRANGALFCNLDGIPEEIPGGPWSRVSTQDKVGCAIRADQTLWCWGTNAVWWDDPAGPPLQEATQSQWIDISIGGAICAIRADGRLFCWGDPTSVCIPNFESKVEVGAHPFLQISDGDWLDVEVGPDRACAIKNDGTLWCWGGIRSPYSPHECDNALLQEPTHATWRSVAPTVDRTCAVRTDGKLFCWGGMSQEDFNHLDYSSANVVPIQVSPASDFAAITFSVDGDNVCTLSETGALACGGADTIEHHFEGGYNPDLDPIEPVAGQFYASGPLPKSYTMSMVPPCNAVSPVPTGRRLAVGERHSCAIDSSGTLQCWAKEFSTTCGYCHSNSPTPGDSACVTVPVQASAIAPTVMGTNVMSVYVRAPSCDCTEVCDDLSNPACVSCELQAPYTLALHNDGTIHAGNGLGELPQIHPYLKWLSATLVGSFNYYGVGVDACGVDENHTLRCWSVQHDGPRKMFAVSDWVTMTPGGLGTHVDGQLTYGWELIGFDRDWSFVTSSGGSYCGLRTGNKAWCGRGGYWTTPSQVAQVTMVNSAEWLTLDMEGTSTCGIQTDGSLWCWSNDNLIPIRQGLANNWVATSGHRCAIDSNDAVWCAAEGETLTMVQQL